MAYPVITGAVLVEANGAALNNAGQAEGLRVDNAVVVKQIRLGRLRFPYVSGQAWRRWWREVLYQDFGWKPSEVTREAKSAYTAGDPILYEEDDIFGYMAARKRKKPSSSADTGSGTYRRISPLKNSLLISVLPNVITRDFGHFSRNLPPDADIIPFESEHYTTYLQGVFTISLSDVGRFAKGEMADLSEELVKAHSDVLEKDEEDDRVYRINLEERIRRVRDALKALARLRGGAQLARNLSEVSPVVVLVGFLDGGNAPFQRIFEADINNERIVLNLQRLESVLTDYKDRVLLSGNGKPVFFGYRPALLANEEEVLSKFTKDEPFSDLIDVVGTPNQALEKAAELVDQVFSAL
ncbi:type I-B CRISPR-associated protein Cas7/Cst2/DevR [Thermodesulforhabdus norvegica]|uniref:CRISPR-associated autoregulator, Cst2 family n=1 Tax=Thermodesulforhabdus norvegica TaxID=39841 RepID=A0A1I4TNH5_9BACT|nr:type I-B CRISPR-associated protein Cas7/Cst2/DevR [Thermodesulforhabdus norvegica]SFM78110.1 CRISPR-associated autoregulator, Cst2 family [Thermodesulforhabdus norvegica]